MSAALKSAIAANDPAAVRDAISAIKDINAKLFDGKNAVALACELGADLALGALLEAKAKVQGKYTEHPFGIAGHNHHQQIMQLLVDRKKVSEEAMDNALNHAIRHGHVETLQFMLRQFKPPISMVAIMLAGQYDQPDAIRALAAAGADMNATKVINHKQTPALHIVVANNHFDAVRAMVECGANINARDEWGATPLMELADAASEFDRQVENHFAYQEHLKERAQKNPERAEALLNSPAAKQPRPPSGQEALQSLLDLGADATLKDNEGNDAFDYYRFQACRRKTTPEKSEVIELLRKAGATGDDATFNLFAAINAKDLDAVRKAIASGANVNRIDPAPGSQNTPLTLAGKVATLEIANALIDAGADVNKPDRNDRPLLSACQWSNLPVVQRLIEAGADPALRQLHDIADDCLAMNAYETAHWMKRKDVMQYLKSIGAHKLAKPTKIEAGIHSWEDFAEVLVKGDVPTIAAVIAKMIDGKIQTDVYEKNITPGKHAFLVVRPVGMAWCNIFQLAPFINWLRDTKAGEKFAADISKAADAPALFIAYSDTSDAAMSIRYEPAAKPKKKNGRESDNDWLINLAKKELLMAAAFRPELEQGKPTVDILFSTFSAEAFDGIACITT